MSPIQQMLLGVGAVATKTYVDDVFSTYLWEGDGNSGRTITNNIDVSGEGALVWMKSRSTGNVNVLFDTERGANQRLRSDSNLGQNNTDTLQPSFTSSGFTVGSGNEVNGSGNDYTSWTFRKAPGFFTICEWTGNGSGPRSISHDLGSVPGLIMIKRTNGNGDWRVWHRSFDKAGDNMRLNANSAVSYDSAYFGGVHQNSTKPTSTSFNIGTSNDVNGNGETYIAYLWGGGPAPAGVDFDGTDDYLSFTGIPIGTNDFTMEAWIYPTGGLNYPCILDTRNTDDDDNGFFWGLNSSNRLYLYTDSGDRVGGTVNANQWSHVALVRDYSATTTTMYINGSSVGSWSSDNLNYSNVLSKIGFSNTTNTHHYWDGKISNVRITIGQTLYTSSFTPTLDPLTTTSQGATASNVKLLCCNGSSTTSATVGTITANGSPTASSDSPFDDDDPAGFVFGDAGDQNVIKCGSYTTDSNEDATVHLGWEPQWVFAKRTDSTGDWRLYDSMRGLPNAQDIAANNSGSKYLEANDNAAESNSSKVGPTSTGFYADQDGANRTYIYCAIRRPDGYVGKPVELGTDAFNVVYGNSSSTIPNFPGNFPVDMGIYKEPANSYSWYLHTRLVGPYNLKTDSTDTQKPAAPGDPDATFDSNAGWGKFGYNTDKASWFWKRHAGFDVVAYKGSGLSAGDAQDIRHGLNAVPEMMIVKIRDAANQDWMVYHKGLNGGTNPEQYKINLNNANAESSFTCWDNSAPTATSFRVGNQVETNHGSYNFIAMLFASVDGISKVGYYSGDGTSSNAISCGFQPRFVFIKRADSTGDWKVWDSLRGTQFPFNNMLSLNTSNAQVNDNLISFTSTGFSLISSDGTVNANSGSYMFYAHA